MAKLKVKLGAVLRGLQVGTENLVVVTLADEHPAGAEPPPPNIRSSKITIDGKSFIDWFNAEMWELTKKGTTPVFKHYTFKGFNNVFDHIKDLSGKDELTLAEFVAYFCIVYNEHAGTFESTTEGAKEGKPDSYFFEGPGSKSSYNGLYQRFAGDQLGNAPDGNAYKGDGGGAGWGYLTRKADIDAWNSQTSYPHDPPPGSAFTGNATGWSKIKEHARKCDFYKFRGRGLNQITFRGNYRTYADPTLKVTGLKKASADLTSEQLDEAMAKPEVYFPIFRRFFTTKFGVLDKVNLPDPDWSGFAEANGGSDYVAKFTKRCKKLYEAMKSTGYTAE